VGHFFILKQGALAPPVELERRHNERLEALSEYGRFNIIAVHSRRAVHVLFPGSAVLGLHAEDTSAKTG
jgi:uroporphyrinogen-III synthase